MTRAEHLQWAKDRALELLDAGDLPQAFASITSDLMKHDELARDHSDTLPLGMQLMITGNLSTPEQMRHWIEGFN